MNASQDMPRDKFLTVAVNLLNKALLESERAKAKGLYRDLRAGKRVNLARLRMENNALVDFFLTLDASCHRGELRFSSLRNAVRALLARLADTLRQQRDIRVFTQEGNPRSAIFGVNGVIVDSGVVNVIVLGVDSSEAQGGVCLQLLFLDPSQFEQAEGGQDRAGEGAEAPAGDRTAG